MIFQGKRAPNQLEIKKREHSSNKGSPRTIFFSNLSFAQVSNKFKDIFEEIPRVEIKKEVTRLDRFGLTPLL